MQLSVQTINYLESLPVNSFINSNIIITDLTSVIYTSNFANKDYYISEKISNDLQELIDYWNTIPISEDIFYLKNKPNINIVSDYKENYDSLIIFPLYLNNNIKGLAIFFRYTGEYIDTSLKAPNTIRKWVMKIMGNETFPIHRNIF